MANHQNIAEWHGKTLVDREGQKIGSFRRHVDVETDEPMCSALSGGPDRRHLTSAAGRAQRPDPCNGSDEGVNQERA